MNSKLNKSNSTFYLLRRQAGILHSTFTRGFTLIELLVAATIIGILTAIAVVNFSVAQRKARDGKRKADLESIRGALEMRRVDFGSYRTTDLPWGSVWQETQAGNTYTYMQKVPQDPKDPTYVYFYGGSSSTYSLCAYLESGGTDTCGGSCGSSISCNYKVSPP